MGLDMYLEAEKYVSGYSFNPESETYEYKTIVDILGAGELASKDNPSATVRVKVGYWRKANAVHNWFVQNCQNGVDECQETWVSREQLQELSNVCQEVLADKSKTEELLPSTAGFFFGNTDYDNYYYGQLEETVKMIESLLKKAPSDWDFYYRSSW